jgi:hypothetical protein
MHVYLEVGKKRVFAGALDWPGWCRSGKDENLAVGALLQYGQRYRCAIERARLGFEPPEQASDFTVAERLTGGAGTDYGAPTVAPAADAREVSLADLQRFQALLEAIWCHFDAAVQLGEGKQLRLGPRGGGRNLEKIVRHVLEGEMAYLTQLGGKFKWDASQADARQAFPPLRQAILHTLGEAVRGALPSQGPRGGQRWRPRFYVRYSAWHLLDHAWEIEDRIL